MHGNAPLLFLFQQGPLCASNVELLPSPSTIPGKVQFSVDEERKENLTPRQHCKGSKLSDIHGTYMGGRALCRSNLSHLGRWLNDANVDVCCNVHGVD